MSFFPPPFSLSQKKKKHQNTQKKLLLTVRQPQLRPRVLVLRQLGPDQPGHLGVPRQPLLPALDVAQQPLVLVELRVAAAEDVEVRRDLGLGLALDLGRDADRVVAAVLRWWCDGGGVFCCRGFGEEEGKEREREKERRLASRFFSFSLSNEKKSSTRLHSTSSLARSLVFRLLPLSPFSPLEKKNLPFRTP